jgi:hypothetical protein
MGALNIRGIGENATINVNVSDILYDITSIIGADHPPKKEVYDYLCF